MSSLRLYDVLGRIGGEEFLLIMSGIAGQEAASVLERVRMAVRSRPFELPGGGSVAVTVSLGGATAEDETSEQLLTRADDALYQAKAQGRDRVIMAPALRSHP